MSSSSRFFSRAVKRAAFARAAGRCQCVVCGGAPLMPPRIEFDHIVPWEISRDSSLSNCQVLRTECSRRKTALVDAPLIAAAHRKHDRHIGAHRSRHPMPAGRKSRWTRPIGGFRPVPRLTQAQKLKRTLSALRGEFAAEALS